MEVFINHFESNIFVFNMNCQIIVTAVILQALNLFANPQDPCFGDDQSRCPYGLYQGFNRAVPTMPMFRLSMFLINQIIRFYLESRYMTILDPFNRLMTATQPDPLNFDNRNAFNMLWGKKK